MLRLLPAPWRRGAWRLRACYQDAAASRQIARTSRLLNEPDPFFALFSDLLLGKMNLTPFFYQDAAASRQIARTSRLLNEPDPFFPGSEPDPVRHWTPFVDPVRLDAARK